MLSRIIEVCARNRFLVFTAVLLLTLAGIWSSAACAAGRIAGHLRCAGHRPHSLGKESRPMSSKIR